MDAHILSASHTGAIGLLGGGPPTGGAHAAIAAYYDYTLPLYRMFWHGETGAVHYGFRDHSTRTARDELLNTNRFLATTAGVTARSRVLDAGCGVGGSAVWLARTLGATTVGITLSARQAERARVFAASRGVAERTAFEVRDYLATGFPDASFDVVWALESACYATDKHAFLAEAFRLLRPGGRVVVGDGFLRRLPVAPRDVADLRVFLRGLLLPTLVTVSAFLDAMAAVGFCALRAWDKTTEAFPSARRLRSRCRLAYPFARLGEGVGLTPPLLTDNVRAGLAQFRLIRAGVAAYAVMCGEKPGS